MSAAFAAVNPTPRIRRMSTTSLSIRNSSFSPGMNLPSPKFWTENLYSPSAGKAVPDRHPAARAERQAFDVLVLRGVRRRDVGRFRRRLPEADRRARDPCRRGQCRLRAGSARWSTNRRRCRNHGPNRRPAAASRRRSRDPADRGRRWRIRSGSGDAARPSRGSDAPAALRSISASSQSRSPSYFASGGRGIPGGGIMPARSLRMTFSHTSG